MYRPRRKAEQWTSSHKADCGQTDSCENITFPLQSVKIGNTVSIVKFLLSYIFVVSFLFAPYDIS